MRDLILIIEQYGLPFVFLNVLMEQGGLPVPAYPTLMFAAALAASSSYRPYQIVAVAVAAALIADLCWYSAGRRHGYRVLGTLCRLSLSPDSCVRKTQDLFGRFGAVSLAFAKFVPGFALLATALAGAARTRLSVFLVFDVIGATLWSGVAVFLGVTFRGAIDDVIAVLSNLGSWGLLLLAALLLLYVATKWWQRHRFIRRLRMDRISVDELNVLLGSGRRPLILDTRPEPYRLDGGVIPGALAVDIEDVAAVIRSMAHDAEVVVYCACPNEASAALVARRLLDGGFKKVRPLYGGIDAWVAAGHPLEAVEPLAGPPARADTGT